MTSAPVRKLRKSLARLAPVHDTPIGLVHPYWARKPLNIIRQIVRSLSAPGDTVGDPFMGSGTSVFAALSEGRHAVGSDINPLSVSIVAGLLSFRNKSATNAEDAKWFVEQLTHKTLPWFSLKDSPSVIERVRYTVAGTFEGGAFKLKPTEWVLKIRTGTKWSGRHVRTPDRRALNAAPPLYRLSHPVKFGSIRLKHNSRIAIPRNSKLADFFSHENQAVINEALTILASDDFTPESRPIIQLLISSSLPLLRLSDKKASSQWPYWRPKDSLTSRTPIFVFEKRLQALENARAWVQDLDSAPTASVRCAPAQSFSSHPLKPRSLQLILTDPPYADQAPYLEYSAMWNDLFGHALPANAHAREVVKTDAPDRTTDNAEYAKRLESSLYAAFDAVKIGGYAAVFYQDHNLSHWAVIAAAARRAGMRAHDVIPLKKQRRSMKTVASPGRTLDGDLLLVLKRNRISGEQARSPVDEAARKNRLSQINRGRSSFLTKYNHVIKAGFMENWIESFIDAPITVADALKEAAN